MGNSVWILGIIAIVVILGYIAYQNSMLDTIQNDLEMFYNVKEECINDNCISLLLPKKVQSDDTAEQKIKTQSIVPTNDTKTNDITQQNDLKYEKYQLGNIPPIEGYIQLHDPNTGDPIKPYYYDAFIMIECSDLNEFCNLDDRVHRMQTVNGGTDSDGNELGGYFKYDWSRFATHDDIIPSTFDQMFYDVHVKVDSPEKIVSQDNMNEGRYQTVENDYVILITR